METVLILDFGAQYSQLIARRVREQNVYCEVKPCSISPDEIRELAPHLSDIHCYSSLKQLPFLADFSYSSFFC